ncbi:MAG: hypothetical protein GY768_15255 [Planctomycetaceae bacterium]|nr:hypothetical protein [Planctomycetaceae bacterium]
MAHRPLPPRPRPTTQTGPSGRSEGGEPSTEQGTQTTAKQYRIQPLAPRGIGRKTALIAIALLLTIHSPSRAAFDLVFSYDPTASFEEPARALLDTAIDKVEKLWEGVILGHEGNESTPFEIEVGTTRSSLALGSPASTSQSDGLTIATSGWVKVNPEWVELATNGFGIDSAAGINLLDELISHEVGHALGIGSLWDDNQLYNNHSGRYTGQYGLQAFRMEFSPQASYIPVELAGDSKTANGHWDQLLRSSAEGNPDDPWSLSPLTGILDSRGRDFGQELMSGAIDPDYGEPFLSNTTVQSLRDLGYTVIPHFPLPADKDENGILGPEDLDRLASAIRTQSTDPFYDVNQDGDLDLADYSDLITMLDTVPGDSNFDRRFDSQDFIITFQTGEYEDNQPANSTWIDGDWTGDTEFDSRDFVYAFQYGAYQTQQVPEPSRTTLLITALCFTLVTLHFRRQTDFDRSAAAE